MCLCLCASLCAHVHACACKTAMDKMKKEGSEEQRLHTGDLEILIRKENGLAPRRLRRVLTRG